MCSARTELLEAEKKYHAEPSKQQREVIKDKKKSLDNAYLQAEEDALVMKIKRAENCADRCKNKESWTLINDISGRKNSGGSLVEGDSSDQRKKIG